MVKQYVSTPTSETLEIKRSKFITFVLPYHQFDTVMKKLKEEHPKGRHFVYAYRYLNEFDQIVENQSDDGEPKGSSGKPTLSVLRGAELINSAVIIVRYFGGIKLGVGGLVRAYSDATNLAISTSKLLIYRKLKRLKVTVSYSNLGKVEHCLKGFELENIQKNFMAEGVILSLDLAEENVVNLKELIKDYAEVELE
ncbi:MAG: YigZ family protein [Bacteriovoracaceae bacterium]|nr:YigZ family protein [Bacteriovoracaceae bacterium]